MPIRFRCTCGKKYKVAEDFIGKTVACKKCGNRLVVPNESTEPASESKPTVRLPQPMPPQTGADELELMAEAPPPPVDPQGDFGAAGQRATPDASDMELMAEPLPPPVDAQADFGLPSQPQDLDNAEPGQAPPGEAKEVFAVETQYEGETEKCEKCGAVLTSDAIMCVECGARIGAKMPEGVVKQQKKPLPKGVFIGAGIGLLLVASIVAGLIMMLGGDETPSPAEPDPVVAQRPQQRPLAPPPPPPQPKPPVEEAPPPVPLEITWEGFNDPILAVRDRLREVGAALQAYEKENNTPAPSLEAAGIPAEDNANIVFVPPERTAAMGLRPVAYQKAPNSDGTVWVLFHDETVREVGASDLSAVLPQEGNDAVLPGANIALVRKLDPVLRVVNERFAEVETLVDGETVGRVKMGETATFPVLPGRHDVALRAKGLTTDPLPHDFARGLTCEYALPKFQDLPVLDLRTYRGVFKDPGDEYTLDRNDPNTTVMKNEFETIRLPYVAGQASIATDLRSMRGTIERKNRTIAGIEDDPIYVSKQGLLEEGAVQYKHGETVLFRRTALQTIRISRHANLDVASLAMLSADATEAFQSDSTGQFRDGGRPTGRRDPTFRPGPEGEPPKQESPDLVTPTRRLAPKPDLVAFGPSFADMFSEAVQVLLNESKRSESAPETPERAPRGEYGARPPAANAPRSPAMGEPRRPDIQVDSRGRPILPGENPDGNPTRRTQIQRFAPEALPELPAQKIFAMLAVYGNPNATATIDRLAAQGPAQASWNTELLLARARCAGRNAIVSLNAAARGNPLGGAIGLAMIEDPGADQALGEILKSWTPRQFDDVAEAFPDAAGPGGRRRFLEAWFANAGEKVFSAAYLNALMRIDPYVVERELAARLLGDPNGASVSEKNLACWRVMTRCRRTEAVETLVEQLVTGNSESQQAALLALGETHHASILPCLEEALANSDQAVARAACAALIGYGDEKAVAILAEKMPKDLCPARVTGAALKLAETAGPDNVADLLASMLAQSMAVGPADQDTPKEPAGPPPGVPQNPLMQRRLIPTQPMKTPAAASAPAESLLETLKKLNRPTPVVLAAVDEARKHAAFSVRIAAYRTAIALRTADPAAASAIAAEGLTDANASVRAAVAAILRAIPPEMAASLIETAAQDSDPSVRGNALRSVTAGHAASPNVVAAVAAALKDEDWSVVAAAGSAAEAVKTPSLGPEVVAALARLPAETTAQPTGLRLGQQEETSSVPVPQARIALIRAAGALRERGATQTLALLLSTAPSRSSSLTKGTADADTVRVEAARALGTIGDPSAVDGLARALQIAPQRAPAFRLTRDDGDSRQSPADPLSAAVLTALTQYDTPKALNAWALVLTGGSEGGSLNIHPELREIALRKIVPACAEPGLYRQWILDQPDAFSAVALNQLADMARDAPPEWRASLRFIGTRGLLSKDADILAGAATLLSRMDPDPEILNTIFGLLEENASSVAAPLAEIFRKTRDPNMLPVLKDHYRAIGRLSRTAEATVTGGFIPGRTGRGTAQQQKGLPQSAYDAVVTAIIEAIGAIGGEDAATELNRISYAEKSPVVLEALVEALPKTKSPAAVSYLGRLARGRDELAPVAARALFAASEYDVEEARKAFERLTKGFDPYMAAIGADGWYALDAKGLLTPENAPSL